MSDLPEAMKIGRRVDPFCGPEVTADQALEALSNLMRAAGFTTSESANILCRFIMAQRASEVRR